MIRYQREHAVGGSDRCFVAPLRVLLARQNKAFGDSLLALGRLSQVERDALDLGPQLSSGAVFGLDLLGLGEGGERTLEVAAVEALPRPGESRREIELPLDLDRGPGGWRSG